MLIVVPSRGRPESVRRMLQSFQDMETRALVMVRIDDDDETMKGFSGIEYPNVIVVSGKQVKSAGAMEEALQFFPGEDCYALVGDDCVARTKHWDEELRKTAGDWHIAFPEDLLKGRSLAAHPVVGGKLIKALGFWALPGLTHLYQDKVIDFLGRLYGNLIFRGDVVLEHLHFSNGKSPMDATYERTFNGEPHAQRDHDVYTAWSLTYRKDEAIAQAISEEAKAKKLPRPELNVSFVCLKAGAAYGPEYVNILLDMVTRNVPEGVPIRFLCLTDDPSGLDPRIEVIPLPEDLETWWGKLYLFKRGLFQYGARVIFMDLDTLIVGGLAEIMGYRGQFATLNDFYYPGRVGPAIMLWEAGDFASSIWEEWVAEGKPRHEMGDLWWLNKLDQGRFARKLDKLQNLFPGRFVSFKANCHPYPPKGARVVCFHGQPKPHNCEQQWVADCWKLGGGGMSDIEVICNTARALVVENVRGNAERDLPWLDLVPVHEGHAVIVGGGPSVGANLDEIRWRQSEGQIVVALNGSAKYLKRHGIIADWQVIVDSKPQCAGFALPEAGRHFVCSQCDASVFEALAGREVTVFHVNTEPTLEVLSGGREAHLVSTGSTVGLIAMGIVHTQGYRFQHLYGFDSSYAEGQHHAYEQKMNDDDRVLEATAGGRTFRAAPWMVAQVEQFQILAPQLAEDGCTITVAGDGLLPHVARLMSQPQEIAA